MAIPPTERTLQTRSAAYASWAVTPNRSARTQPARDALMRKFEAEVDPDGALLPDERRKRAEAARKAHFARMAWKSAKARRLRREADQLAAEAEAGAA